ncbi:hypothetical protein [Rhodovastum atsumiense]|uniref:Lipoprotein n=1 Tax=Rhodovastum atsumiense TaxID=504468 RepID=A0A5M6IMM8_9PROT|nr:hypothetical protein [Rhodovastum atsumiense]KAA5609207.1 hypothetical protein F1189_25260 [Rhodovastum atsumiense]
MTAKVILVIMLLTGIGCTLAACAGIPGNPVTTPTDLTGRDAPGAGSNGAGSVIGSGRRG